MAQHTKRDVLDNLSDLVTELQDEAQAVPAQPAPNAAPVEAEAPAPGHNNPPRCTTEAEAMRAYGTIGGRAAAGELAGAEFLALVAENCRERLHEVSSDNAKEIYKAYRDAKIKKMGKLVVDSTKEANFNQKASNVSTVMRAASWPSVDMTVVFNEARPVILAMAKEHKKNTWDAFVAIAVAQNAQKDRQLTISEIEKALMPKSTTKDKGETAQLEKIAKALKRLVEGAAPSEDNPEGSKGYPSSEAANAIVLVQQRLAVCKFNDLKNKQAAEYAAAKRAAGL